MCNNNYNHLTCKSLNQLQGNNYKGNNYTWLWLV